VNKLIIDGDACPRNVLDTCVKFSKSKNYKCVLVCNYTQIRNDAPENTEIIYVDNDADAADLKIGNIIRQGDVVVTQDYGLAAMIMEKARVVIAPDGFVFTKENIQEKLLNRHIGKEMRKKGRYPKGKKKRNRSDDCYFEETLVSTLE
jgi:uncharacterized protein YaiI (UPF0178 family)